MSAHFKSPFAGLFGLCWGLARVGRLARLRVDWPPAIGRLFGRGFGPGWFGGVDWPGGLLGLVGPFGWPGFDRAGLVQLGRVGPFAGGDWRGLQRLGRVGWPPLIGAGLAPGRLGGAGRLAPNHANPGGLCNDFPVILHFL